MKITHDFAGGIEAMRSRSFPFQQALLELIDNSVDEGATTVVVRMDKNDLIIEDNGAGFTDIESALVIGKSFKVGKIGRYGVGLKQTCSRYSDTTIIESNGHRVCVPWKSMATGRHDGDLGDPELVDQNGITKIILEGFRGRYTKAIETADIRRTYHPLIAKGGLSITVTGTRQEPLKLPKFIESIDTEVIYDGKRVAIVGGIYRPDDLAKKDWRGYNLYYNGRLIGGKITTEGNDCGCSNFSFMVYLIDGENSWSLATNKDDVEDTQGLLDFIYHGYTRVILEHGVNQSALIELKHIEDKVNAELNPSSSGNITRGPRLNKNTKKSNDHEPGPQKRNTNTATMAGEYVNSGAAGKKSARGKIKFSFAQLGGESIGEIVDTGRAGLSITANLNNPFIEANKSNDALILFFAKMSYSMYRKAASHDTMPDEFAQSIMESAGEEIAFSHSFMQSNEP